MDSGYIAHRITQLRMARNISEYQMSLELGHSKSYIQSITSGKSLPSSQELFNIADYFDMSMSEFFDEGNVLSPTVQKAINAIRKLNEQDAALVLSMIQRLSLPLGWGASAASPLGLFQLTVSAVGAIISSIWKDLCHNRPGASRTLLSRPESNGRNTPRCRKHPGNA